MNDQNVVYIALFSLLSLIIVLLIFIVYNYRKIKNVENTKNKLTLDQKVYGVNDKLHFETSKSIIEYINSMEVSSKEDVDKMKVELKKMINDNKSEIDVNTGSIIKNEENMTNTNTKFDLLQGIIHYDLTKLSIKLIDAYTNKFSFNKDEYKNVLLKTNLFNSFEYLKIISNKPYDLINENEDQVLLIFQKIFHTFDIENVYNLYDKIHFTNTKTYYTNNKKSYLDKYIESNRIVINQYFQTKENLAYFLNVYFIKMLDYINESSVNGDLFTMIDDLILKGINLTLKYKNKNTKEEIQCLDDIVFGIDWVNPNDTILHIPLFNDFTQLISNIPNTLNNEPGTKIIKRLLCIIIPYTFMMFKYNTEYDNKYIVICDNLLESLESDIIMSVMNIKKLNNILNIITCNGDDYKHNLFNQGLMRHLSSEGTVTLPETLDDDPTQTNLLVFNNVLKKHNTIVDSALDIINQDKTLSYNDFICCNHIEQGSECWNNEST
jgi:hypothetical protein